MPLEVRPCVPADFTRAAEVERAAFADNPFTDLLFPGPFPEGALEFRSQEIAKQFEEDPTTRWLKVVDTDLSSDEGGDGIAFAKWNVYEDHAPGARPMREFGPGCNAEACKLVFGGLAAQRERILGERRSIYLHILVTDPAHGRRGAAGKLLAWGIDEAKQHKLPLYVESSVEGHELYKRYGFKDIEVRETDLSQWGAKEPHRIWAMINESAMED